jgi:hypothetical protein
MAAILAKIWPHPSGLRPSLVQKLSIKFNQLIIKALTRYPLHLAYAAAPPDATKVARQELGQQRQLFA